MSHSETYAELIRLQNQRHEQLLAQNREFREELNRLKGVTLSVSEETRAMEAAA